VGLLAVHSNQSHPVNNVNTIGHTVRSLPERYGVGIAVEVVSINVCITASVLHHSLVGDEILSRVVFADAHKLSVPS
jgi:hypothetical protein